MYVLISETESYCMDCDTCTRNICGFTKSRALALAHILAGIRVGSDFRVQDGSVPRVTPRSTHHCVYVEDTEADLSDSIVPAGGRLDVGLFSETSDEGLREGATTPDSAAAVSAYIVERERIVDSLRVEAAAQLLKIQEAEDRQRHGVRLVTFPDFWQLLSGGPPGASHKRIPSGDLLILAGNIHTLTIRRALWGTRFCMKVGGARYEVEVRGQQGVPTCICDDCVKANRKKFSEDHGRRMFWGD
jgi:hypothetical protein